MSFKTYGISSLWHSVAVRNMTPFLRRVFISRSLLHTSLCIFRSAKVHTPYDTVINVAYYAPGALVSPTAVQFFNLPHVENPYLAWVCMSEWNHTCQPSEAMKALQMRSLWYFVWGSSNAVIQTPLKWRHGANNNSVNTWSPRSSLALTEIQYVCL